MKLTTMKEFFYKATLTTNHMLCSNRNAQGICEGATAKEAYEQLVAKLASAELVYGKDNKTIRLRPAQVIIESFEMV